MGLHTGSTAVWTGTNTDGSTSADHLGNFFGVIIGNSIRADGNWVNNGTWPTDTTSGAIHMYGISEVLIAASALKPPTLVMALTAISAGSAAAGSACVGTRSSWAQ